MSKELFDTIHDITGRVLTTSELNKVKSAVLNEVYDDNSNLPLGECVVIAIRKYEVVYFRVFEEDGEEAKSVYGRLFADRTMSNVKKMSMEKFATKINNW